MSNFAIFRVQKLKSGSRGSGTLGQTLKHLKNHLDSAEISKKDMSKYNTLQGCTDYKTVSKIINKFKKVHKENNKRAVKKTASVGLEFVFSYTADNNNQNMKFAEQFEKSINNFMRKEFPNVQILVVARHTDEKSFHWHLVVIPYDRQKKRFSAKDLLGGPREMSKLQDSFAECCKSLDLQRGISKKITKSNHKTKQEYNRQKLLQQEQQLKEATQVRDEVLR